MVIAPREFRDYVVTAWVWQWGLPDTVQLRVRAPNAKEAAADVRRAGYHRGILSVRRVDPT